MMRPPSTAMQSEKYAERASGELLAFQSPATRSFTKITLREKINIIALPKSLGVARVMTLSLMILLVAVAVGLLLLSLVSLRIATHTIAQAKEHASARLGRLLASGELQTSPDRDANITASSAVLDENPETPAADGVNYPHFTGCGAVRQKDMGETQDYDCEISFRNWLVSNAQPSLLSRRIFARSGSLFELFTLGNQASRRNVGCGKIEVGRVRTLRGGFAWWVGDENCKALISPCDDSDPKDNSNIADLLARFVNPSFNGLGILETFEEFHANITTSEKLIGSETLPLLAISAGAKNFFHDLSPHPRSVLANGTEEGLRKDPSLYLERTEINWIQGWGIPEGATGLTWHERNKCSQKFV